MKKALVIISLVVLLAIPVVGLMGCGGGTNITDNDIATFRGLLTRMDDVEEKNSDQDIAIKAVTAPDLSGYVTLEKYNDLKDDFDELAKQVKELENGQSSGGDNPSPPNLTGQTTVTLDAATPLTQILTNPTAVPVPFYVKIVNGTNTPQYVTYGVIFTVLSPTLSADMEGGTAVYTLGISGAAYGGTLYPFTPTAVPNAAAAQQILFTFPIATAPKIPVLAGQTVTIYNTLNLRTDSTPYAYWQGGLTGVVVSPTP